MQGSSLCKQVEINTIASGNETIFLFIFPKFEIEEAKI